MPRHIEIVVECDLCETEIPGAGEPETFTRGKRAVETDLCEKCKAKIDKVLDPVFEKGHKPGKELALPGAPKRVTVERQRDPGEPVKCREGCETWFASGSGRASHERGCDGSPPPFPCKVPGCKTGYRTAAALRLHMETGEHVIPIPVAA